MELSEAKRLVEKLVDQYRGLTTIGEALKLLDRGEAKLATLQSQKSTLESVIEELSSKLKGLQGSYRDKVESLETLYRVRNTELEDEVTRNKEYLDRLKIDIAESKGKVVNETKEMLVERNKVLSGINAEISTRQSKLDGMNKQIDTLRNKFV